MYRSNENYTSNNVNHIHQSKAFATTHSKHNLTNCTRHLKAKMYRYTQLVVFVFLLTLSISLAKSTSVTTEGYKCQRGQCWTEVKPRDDFCSEIFRYEFTTMQPANLLCYCCRRL